MRRFMLLGLLGLLVVAALSHRLWLSGIGGVLVTQDDLGPSDVIVVLAGNSPFRARNAETLYARGLAPHVIISNEPLSTLAAPWHVSQSNSENSCAS